MRDGGFYNTIFICAAGPKNRHRLIPSHRMICTDQVDFSINAPFFRFHLRQRSGNRRLRLQTAQIIQRVAIL